MLLVPVQNVTNIHSGKDASRTAYAPASASLLQLCLESAHNHEPQQPQTQYPPRTSTHTRHAPDRVVPAAGLEVGQVELSRQIANVATCRGMCEGGTEGENGSVCRGMCEGGTEGGNSSDVATS